MEQDAASSFQPFWDSVVVRSDTLGSTVSGLKHVELKKIGEAFQANTLRAYDPLVMVRYLAMDGYMGTLQATYLAVAMTKMMLKGESVETREGMQRARQMADELMRQQHEREKLTDMMMDASEEKLKSPHVSEFAESRVGITYSIITSFWTAFEVLAGDVWRLVLNESPNLVTKKTTRPLLEDLGKDEGAIDAKAIKIGAVAKYGFDLRNHMGDILAETINFSDIDRVKKAYLQLFENDTQLLKLFSTKELKQLECCRHLINHRAAVVDARFVRDMCTGFEIGRPLPIAKNFVLPMLQSAVDVGGEILQFADGWSQSKAEERA